MEYKKVSYEIIENVPSILITKYFIVNIVSVSAYFISALFVTFSNWYKTKAFFSSNKKLEFRGEEIKTSVNIDFNENVAIKDDLKVLRTEILFFNKKESLIKLKEALVKNPDIDISKIPMNFTLKEKIEFTNKETPQNYQIFKSVPVLALKINKILKLSYFK